MGDTSHGYNTKLIIVADLGLLRAYREVQGLGDREPHLELTEELKPEAAHQSCLSN